MLRISTGIAMLRFPWGKVTLLYVTRRSLFLAFSISSFLSACSGNPPSDDHPGPNIITVNQTIEIPVQDSINLLYPEKLTIYKGVEDEEPEGPSSFDVLRDNGGFVISDPLRDRVVFYDASGNYLKYADTAFPVSRIKTMDERTWLLQSATSDELKMLKEDNPPNPNFSQQTTTTNEFEDSSAGTRLLPNNQAVVWRNINNQTDSIRISYDGEENLVSVQYLDQDQNNNTAVSLETAVPADSISAHVMVRVYDVKKRNIAEVNDIDENMLVYPIDQFRYHNGKLYQMMVLSDKVLIKIWNML